MKSTPQKNQNKHIAVLLTEVLSKLDPQIGNSYLDVTAGYGGHAGAILEKTKTPLKTTLVDRDKESTDHLSTKFAGEGVNIVREDYLSASRKLVADGKKFDLILADLGVSSPHLNEASRGFSFKSDGPLDMRMDRSQSLMASDIVNHYPEDKLAKLIKEYGEEPKTRQIAKSIVRNRPVKSTDELASIIKRAYPGYSKVHPATRTFQALRIAVNDELNQLELALPLWLDLLEDGGRLAVISFHSLEDRIVKQFFKELSGNRYDSVLELINKQPITAGIDELVTNPRSRSAKLRVVAKINKKKGGV